jgi:methionyl aminopeptidase
VAAGRTTDEIDRLTHGFIVDRLGCYPSPLGYNKFPKSICTSINDVLCHGIPDDRPLAMGERKERS